MVACLLGQSLKNNACLRKKAKEVILILVLSVISKKYHISALAIGGRRAVVAAGHLALTPRPPRFGTARLMQYHAAT